MGNSNIQLFENKEFGQIRAVTNDDGEPLFVANDVCQFFGVTNKNRVLQQLDNDEKGGTQIDTPGGKQTMTCLTESGLYHLLFIIQPTKARGISQEEIETKRELVNRYKRWVTHEVLPAIRRDGGYMMASQDETPEETMARALLIAQKTIERKSAEIDALKPKALFADAVSSSKASILIGDLAKLLRQNGVDTGQKRLFEWLRRNGYLIKQKGLSWNMPTQRSADMGLFEVKERSRVHPDGHISLERTTVVTGKGQVYFINKFCGVAKA